MSSETQNPCAALAEYRCNKCGLTKAVTAFAKDASSKRGCTYTCKACRNAVKLRIRYGISDKEYAHLFNVQQGRCAICGEVSDKPLAVDHDHATGFIRGLLCLPCNQGLGMFNDSRELLKRAVAYLPRPAQTMPLSKLSATTVIGLGHRCRQGKDYVAQIIHEEYPLITQVFHFADALKAYCRIELGMKEKDAPLLQRVGSKLREYNPEVFIAATYWAIQEAKPRYALIPDLRYRNEVDFVKGLGNGFCVKVMRVNADGTPYIDLSRDPNHPSESELDGYHEWDKRLTAVSGDLNGLAEMALLLFDDILKEEGTILA